MPIRNIIALVFASSSIACAVVQTSKVDQNDINTSTNATVFAQPRIQRQLAIFQIQFRQLILAKDFKAAAEMADKAVEVMPKTGAVYYHRACVRVKLGRADAAIDDLNLAMDFGLRGEQFLTQQTAFSVLADRPEWPKLLEKSKSPPVLPKIAASKIEDGIATVSAANTGYLGKNQFAVSFTTDDSREELPIVIGDDPVATLLKQWHAEGTASGLAGVLYDNHDRLHSEMNWKRFPQLSRIKYSKSVRNEGLDNGLQAFFHFDRTMFGNSSTAIVGNYAWRSQPRLAYVDRNAVESLARMYSRNHFYVYPEHADYDPGRNGKGGFGDVYPANTPFVLISQGSSYSDKPFLTAIASTLSAFRPDVFKTLEQNRMVFPCVQMIFRRCLKPIKTDDDYLTGIAHPVVFDGKQIDVEKMVRMAHEIEASNVPPVCKLSVIDEQLGEPGKDYFDIGPKEKLFTTDASIARVFRSVGQTKTIKVSAAWSDDANNRKLKWKWVVLQGDPDLISITPNNANSSEVTITVQHHERRPIRPGSKMETNRVDIGAFVNNGRYYSAPAFVTFYFPDDEERLYDEKGRVHSVVYTDTQNGGNYADPLVVTPKAWTDLYRYAKNGKLKGWLRSYPDRTEEFSATGELVLTRDKLGRPATGRVLRYTATPRKNKAPLLKSLPTDQVVTYRYQSDDDMVGTVVQATRAK